MDVVYTIFNYLKYDIEFLIQRAQMQSFLLEKPHEFW